MRKIYIIFQIFPHGLRSKHIDYKIQLTFSVIPFYPWPRAIDYVMQVTITKINVSIA